MNYSIDYWKKYYKTSTRQEPSDFAKFCIEYMKGSVLDVCCGDGRDSYFFEKGHDVASFDLVAIDKPWFLSLDLKNKSIFPLADNVYCRFVLHAIPEDMEDHVLIQSNKALNNGGLLFIETRSDKGTEDKSHYRRLINLDTLRSKLRNLNFEIIHCEEGIGLSVHYDNPVLIRIIAKKKGEIQINSTMSFEKFHHGKGALNKESAKHLLLSTRKVLKDVPFMLVFGTLLGAYRDNDFIKYDEDVDIATLNEYKGEIDRLIKEGYFAVYGLKFVRTNPVCYSMKYLNDYIDIYFFTGNGNYKCGRRMTIDKKQITDGLAIINFLGEDFQTVHDIEKYLIDKYGSNWREPIKDKHAAT